MNPRTSGAIKGVVPIFAVLSSVFSSVERLEMPKSAIFTHHSGRLWTTSMFCTIYSQISFLYELKSWVLGLRRVLDLYERIRLGA